MRSTMAKWRLMECHISVYLSYIRTLGTMGLLQGLLRGFSGNKKAEKRSLEEDYSPSYYASGLLFGSLGSQTSAMNLPTAYRCINLISDSIASMAIEVKRKNTKAKTSVVKNHPINSLFDGRNNRLDGYTLIKMLIQSVITKGNGFAYIQRGEGGTPKKLIFVESNDVTITYMKETDTLYYTVSYLNRGRRIDPSDMIHLKMMSWNGIEGISLLAMAKRTLGIASATDEQSKNYFEKGGNMSGIVTTPAILNSKQRQEILKSWDSTYSQGSGGIAVLGGGLTYTQISSNAKDSQMVEARQQNQIELCQYFGVPPILLGLQGGNFTSLEDAQNAFLTETLMGYVRMVESEFNRKLLADSEGNLKVIFNFEDILRTQKSVLADYYTKMTTNGIMTVNEVRERIGLPQAANGDDLVIPYTDISMNKIGGQSEDDSQDEFTE